jgi:putative DNA primase/helicase
MGVKDRSSNALSLRALARALGGVVAGSQVLAPGPGHGPKDRSLSIRLSTIDPDDGAPKLRPARGAPPSDDQAKADGIRQALALWGEAVEPRRTLVERYLNSRALELDDDLAGDVLRWHPRIGAMVALFRNIQDGQPQAISRAFLDTEGHKIERKFLGPVTGAAVMLDPFDDVLTSLHIGEGIETCMTARQVEHRRPCWALGSAGGLKATGEPYGGITAFPVLGGIECLTILTENDESGTNARAVEACAARWHAAGREVFLNDPIGGKDLNDAVRLRGAP